MATAHVSVLVVEDETAKRQLIESILEKRSDCCVEAFADAESARATFQPAPPTRRAGLEAPQVVQTVVQLARSPGDGVIAEDIDPEGQLALPQNLGRDLGQGLLSRPPDPERPTQLIDKRGSPL